MFRVLSLLLGMICGATLAQGQTADELVAKNIQAKGGLEKIKAIKTIRITGRLGGGMRAQIGMEAKRPDMIRQTFTLQSMTQIQAYDGSVAWQISPFEGRKDPELLGEEETRTLIEEADFDGPLVDYRAKGNTVEYLGHDTVDGDDVYRLKVTLKNGDIFYYYLDPDSYLEIRIERQHFVHGAVRERVTDYGSYKQVAGVYFPFAVETGPKGRPERQKITFEKIEVNVPIDDSEFKMPVKKP